LTSIVLETFPVNGRITLREPKAGGGSTYA